jgi:membrane associated rhomboid family serine protease
MIPISESVQVRRPAWIAAGLVTLCTIVFLYEVTLPSRVLDAFVQKWGANPHLIMLALAGDPRVPRTELITLFTSQFLHGSWLHLLGNMVFLWVFGRAVEDRFGHIVFLVMYLLGGAAASIFQSWASGSEGTAPLIGASGAIAVVLGAYLVSFPGAWVKVLVPIFFFFWAFDVPAVLMLALWFFGQFFTGIASITQVAAAGNVAVWAHVAGFVIGMAVGILLPKSGSYGPPVRGMERRVGGPGPAGLISSLANLAVLLLGARVVLEFLEIRSSEGVLGQVAAVAYGATNPIVWPFGEFIPLMRFAGRPLDLPAVVVIALVLLLAGVLVQGISGRTSSKMRGRINR